MYRRPLLRTVLWTFFNNIQLSTKMLSTEFRERKQTNLVGLNWPIITHMTDTPIASRSAGPRRATKSRLVFWLAEKVVRHFFNQSQAVAIAKLLLKSNYNFVLRRIFIFRNVNEIFKNCKLRSYPEGFATTVKALLTDTLISGQLYLRPPSQNPVFLNSHTNSVFSHSCKRPALVMDTFFASRWCPLTRASTVFWTLTG